MTNILIRLRNGEGPWSDYRIRLNGETDIDIPLEFVGLDKYCATLGHKVNFKTERI